MFKAIGHKINFKIYKLFTNLNSILAISKVSYKLKMSKLITKMVKICPTIISSIICTLLPA